MLQPVLKCFRVYVPEHDFQNCYRNILTIVIDNNDSYYKAPDWWLELQTALVINVILRAYRRSMD